MTMNFEQDEDAEQGENSNPVDYSEPVAVSISWVDDIGVNSTILGKYEQKEGGSKSPPKGIVGGSHKRKSSPASSESSHRSSQNRPKVQKVSHCGKNNLNNYETDKRPAPPAPVQQASPSNYQSIELVHQSTEHSVSTTERYFITNHGHRSPALADDSSPNNHSHSQNHLLYQNEGPNNNNNSSNNDHDNLNGAHDDDHNNNNNGDVHSHNNEDQDEIQIENNNGLQDFLRNHSIDNELQTILREQIMNNEQQTLLRERFMNTDPQAMLRERFNGPLAVLFGSDISDYSCSCGSCAESADSVSD